MKQGLVQLFVVLTLTLLACKRGPEGPAGPQGPAGPDYVAPYQQGYIKGTIIAQDTFNNRRVRESYNYVYYSQTPCYVDAIGSTLSLDIVRLGDPTINFLRYAAISLDIDTTGGRPTLVRGSAVISNRKPVGDTIVTGYFHIYDTTNATDTLILDSLTFQFTRVSGQLRGIRRDVTPPDTVTFEFESIIPRTYQ